MSPKNLRVADSIALTKNANLLHDWFSTCKRNYWLSNTNCKDKYIDRLEGNPQNLGVDGRIISNLDLIHLVHGRNKWRALVKGKMNLRILHNAGNIMTCWEIVRFFKKYCALSSYLFNWCELHSHATTTVIVKNRTQIWFSEDSYFGLPGCVIL